jgi:sulfur-carrier protein
VVRLRLFGRAAEAAGTEKDEIGGETVSEVLAAARASYGAEFETVVETCRVWVNGVQSSPADPVGPNDEIALLPPVSGG